jgi:hypothetical protein
MSKGTAICHNPDLEAIRGCSGGLNAHEKSFADHGRDPWRKVLPFSEARGMPGSGR